MAAFYGLRRSGVMGLRWSAIDFEGNTLTVDHTVVQYRSDGKNRMKNKSSCRTMPPVPQYRELLLRMQERKAELIHEKICNPDIAFREIAREFGFSSSAHLTCYCKKQFGTTPTHLREESHIKKQS